MKKQNLFLVVIALIGFTTLMAVDNTPIKKKESSQIYGGDTVTTILAGDSVKYATDKTKYCFDKPVKIKGLNAATDASVSDTADVLRLAISQIPSIELGEGEANAWYGDKGWESYLATKGVQITSIAQLDTVRNGFAYPPASSSLYLDGAYLHGVITHGANKEKYQIAYTQDGLYGRRQDDSFNYGAWGLLNQPDLSNYYTKTQTEAYANAVPYVTSYPSLYSSSKNVIGSLNEGFVNRNLVNAAFPYIYVDSVPNMIRMMSGSMAGSDIFRIYGEGTANLGRVVFEAGDDGDEKFLFSLRTPYLGARTDLGEISSAGVIFPTRIGQFSVVKIGASDSAATKAEYRNSLANYVTLNSEQTITANKTISGANLIFSSQPKVANAAQLSMSSSDAYFSQSLLRLSNSSLGIGLKVTVDADNTKTSAVGIGLYPSGDANKYGTMLKLVGIPDNGYGILAVPSVSASVDTFIIGNKNNELLYAKGKSVFKAPYIYQIASGNAITDTLANRKNI